MCDLAKGLAQTCVIDITASIRNRNIKGKDKKGWRDLVPSRLTLDITLAIIVTCYLRILCLSLYLSHECELLSYSLEP